MLQIILVLLYLLVGFVMAVPYTYLAGWDRGNVASAALFLPAVSVILYGFYAACKMKCSEIPWWINRIFWGFFGYCLLPIFANGISLVLKLAGLATVGSFIFEYRYASLVAVPVAVVIGLVAYSFAKSVWRRRFSGNATPPSSTPPSGFGPTKTAVILPGDERNIDTGTFQLVSA